MCWPQPEYVVFPQVRQVAGAHMVDHLPSVRRPGFRVWGATAQRSRRPVGWVSGQGDEQLLQLLLGQGGLCPVLAGRLALLHAGGDDGEAGLVQGS